MASSSLSSTILSVLEDQEPGVTASVKEIVNSVQARLQHQDRIPEANEIRGRLSSLYSEGVLARPTRGHYSLVRTDPNETRDLRQIVEILSDRLRPDTLQRTVLWDATPYLRLAEDGAPGTRLVVEHETASSLRDEVEVAWPAEYTIATWSTNTNGPLGTRLWEPDNPSPYRLSTAIVFADRKKFGATGVTPDGYRTPFPERILVEFLGETGPPEAAPIVWTLLEDNNVRFERFWSAAETLGVTVEVAALLAGVQNELRPQLRTDFTAQLTPVVETILTGER